MEINSKILFFRPADQLCILVVSMQIFPLFTTRRNEGGKNW